MPEHTEEEHEMYERGKKGYKFWKNVCSDDSKLCASLLSIEACKYTESDPTDKNLKVACENGVKSERINDK